MSDTWKEGKRGPRQVKDRMESPDIHKAVMSRQTFGRTETIRRRNRKIWTRLGNKRRRQLDKEAVATDPEV